MGKRRSTVLYASEWLHPPALRACSLAARGLWLEMLGIMYASPHRGYLQLPSGQPVSVEQLASIVGCATDEVARLLHELADAGVFARTKDGVIYSHQMVRDAQWRARCAAAGKRGGGNPALRVCAAVESVKRDPQDGSADYPPSVETYKGTFKGNPSEVASDSPPEVETYKGTFKGTFKGNPSEVASDSPSEVETYKGTFKGTFKGNPSEVASDSPSEVETYKGTFKGTFKGQGKEKEKEKVTQKEKEKERSRARVLTKELDINLFLESPQTCAASDSAHDAPCAPTENAKAAVNADAPTLSRSDWKRILARVAADRPAWKSASAQTLERAYQALQELIRYWHERRVLPLDVCEHAFRQCRLCTTPQLFIEAVITTTGHQWLRLRPDLVSAQQSMSPDPFAV